MKKKILLLNESYMPINIAPFKKYVKLYVTGKIDVLEKYDNDCFQSGIPKFPSVIRLRHPINMTKSRRMFKEFTRKNVLERDNYRCQYCNCKLESSTMHWDHIIPRAKGGPTNYLNIVACCLKCNRKKENKTLNESGLTLVRTPEVPYDNTSIFSLIMKRMNKHIGKVIPDTWINYIYWKK